MSRPIRVARAFVRELTRIDRTDKAAAAAIAAAVALLGANPFDPKLKSHKLGGRLDGSWSASAGYDLRIVFRLAEQGGEKVIVLETCGTHDDVY